MIATESKLETQLTVTGTGLSELKGQLVATETKISDFRDSVEASVGKSTSEFSLMKLKVDEVTSNLDLLEKRTDEVAGSVRKTDFRLNSQLEETSSMCETRSRELGSEIKSLRDEVMSLRSELSGHQGVSSPGDTSVRKTQQKDGDVVVPWAEVISCGIGGGSITTTSLVTTVVANTQVTTTNSEHGRSVRLGDNRTLLGLRLLPVLDAVPPSVLLFTAPT